MKVNRDLDIVQIYILMKFWNSYIIKFKLLVRKSLLKINLKYDTAD